LFGSGNKSRANCKNVFVLVGLNLLAFFGLKMRF